MISWFFSWKPGTNRRHLQLTDVVFILATGKVKKAVTELTKLRAVVVVVVVGV